MDILLALFGIGAAIIALIVIFAVGYVLLVFVFIYWPMIIGFIACVVLWVKGHSNWGVIVFFLSFGINVPWGRCVARPVLDWLDHKWGEFNRKKKW